ncbi:MAG: molecular chaperone HtpG [Planctomycetota bacterium]
MTTQEAQKFSFQAEVNEVLSIVVNSLYSHKEIFLRELISNASDALDHLSFKALTDHSLLGNDKDLQIHLIPDAEARTLTIRDNGVGMTRDELVSHLGTIARSGSKKLMQSLAADKKKDVSLIGQFGVGFYSGYLVADRITVISRAAGSDEAWQWSSEAKGEFTVEKAERATRGTDIVLHLKADESEFLEEWRLKSLVRKYSDYVRHPIRMQVTRKEKVDDKEQEKTELETVNSARALWARPKSEVTAEQYEEFYKHLSHDWEKPLAWTHFKVEGTQELTGLLFVPRKPPFDLFDRNRKGLRLFVKRVFIMDDCEEILPEWLRFMVGVVDSEDLPLNVSREILQQDRTTKMIRKQVVKHALALLEELAKEGEIVEKDDDKETKVERYGVFWQNFGRILKEGVHYEPTAREQIADLLRYPTSTQGGQTSLGDYVQRMQKDQPGIYYLAADNLDTAKNSPHIEALRARDLEVLYMVDPVDEWVVDALGSFQEKKFIAAAKGALDLPESDEAKKKHEEQAGALADLVAAMRNALADDVKEVRVTHRLTDSPACLVSEEHGMSAHVERMLRAQGQDLPKQKRILELNPTHAAVQRLDALRQSGQETELREWSQLLYDQALVAEGSLPEDPARLARAIAKLMAR